MVSQSSSIAYRSRIIHYNASKTRYSAYYIYLGRIERDPVFFMRWKRSIVLIDLENLYSIKIMR